MIANADAARIPLPDKSVHAVITSPPYFGPRKYKGEQARDWPAVSYSPMPGLPPLEVPAMRCELGREKTPEAYIAHLVLCFREVYRVLRDDGVCWVVEGDSYNTTPPGNKSPMSKSGLHGVHTSESYRERMIETQQKQQEETIRQSHLEQGNLLAIPYRLLLALQADGWLVRNDVVWSKVAPMPESVSGTHWERHQVKVHRGKVARQADLGGNGREPHGATIVDKDAAEWADCPGCPRCSATGGYVLRRGSWRHTRSHETVLMLVKGMQYFSDQERVREAASPATLERNQYGWSGAFKGQFAGSPTETRWQEGRPIEKGDFGLNGRNPRDVLAPAPSPFKGEHYAAFPPDLIRPLILSSAPLKCCPVCGAGYAPIVDSKTVYDHTTTQAGKSKDGPYAAQTGSGNGTHDVRHGVFADTHVFGYRPTCTHDRADWQPGLVLDCFAGSGTTGLVCRELGLRFVGLDISGEYLRDIALVRSERLTPDSAMVNLPLFELLQS